MRYYELSKEQQKHICSIYQQVKCIDCPFQINFKRIYGYENCISGTICALDSQFMHLLSHKVNEAFAKEISDEERIGYENEIIYKK